MYQTNQYQGVMAESVAVQAPDGVMINAFFARPLGPGPFPGMVLVHHMPGWDAWYHETTMKFALNGYAAISPNLYFRDGHGSPEDVAAKVRAAGGVADSQAVGDIAASMRYLRALPNIKEKVGVFGTCSGGRHAFLAACLEPGFDAVVDCWGGRVIMSAEELTPKQPVSPVDYIAALPCPILGLFGDEDRSPSPEQVNQLEQALVKHGKIYEFHRYAGAGHGFFYHDRPAYRQEAAVDGWKKLFAFLERYL